VTLKSTGANGRRRPWILVRASALDFERDLGMTRLDTGPSGAVGRWPGTDAAQQRLGGLCVGDGQRRVE